MRKLQDLVRQGDPKVVTFQERDGGPSRLGVKSWEHEGHRTILV